MNIRSISDERSKWLRALQRGVISQENYDKIIDRLDEEEAHLTLLAPDSLKAGDSCLLDVVKVENALPAESG
jgi:hypothetical protein